MEKSKVFACLVCLLFWYFMWLAHGENSDAIMAETLSKISHLLATSGAGAAQVAGKPQLKATH